MTQGSVGVEERNSQRSPAIPLDCVENSITNATLFERIAKYNLVNI